MGRTRVPPVRFPFKSEPVMQNLVDYIAAKLSITSERGVTAIEYGLIAALVAVAVVGVVTLVGLKLTNTFNTVANGLK